MLKTVALFMLMSSGVAFAGVHDACHTDNHDSRVFAVAYTGAIIDLKKDEVVDGKPVYHTPALNYEQAFGEAALNHRFSRPFSTCGPYYR